MALPIAFKHWESREAAAEGLAFAIHQALADAIRADGVASAALAGGTTPGPMFDCLGRMALAWPRVSILPSDERCVPEDHPRSNARLLRETLLKGPAEAARLIPLAPGGEAPPPEGPPGLAAALPLTVCMVGMGEDMHTASLFPGADRLAEALAPGAPPVVPIEAPGAAEPRVTLSVPALTSASHIHVLIFGPAKRAALDKAMQDGPTEEAPIRALLRSGRPVTVHYAD
ncbi:6-phosphogluconolactonase [Rhodovulum sp. DZ06]|uniref:6-phosphogluconolactonase n=1 Tax=Rhodovulum sp. DZ06 TaxID=3425126 RepID=UPI003D33DB20